MKSQSLVSRCKHCNERIEGMYCGNCRTSGEWYTACETCDEIEENCFCELEDPTPYCSGCGAMKQSQCNCGPRADND